MPARLAFAFADLHPAVQARAMCKTCLSTRHFETIDALPEAARSMQFREIEPRLRCVDTGRNKRQPPCGGRMEIEIVTPNAGHAVLRERV